MSDVSLFEAMGGETQIRKLVDHFYDFMEELTEVKNVRDMHPKDISSSRDKLFLFLVGWTGGPQLFVEKYGHPRLRMRHLPFKVDTQARDQWLLCFEKAMKKMNYPEPVTEVLWPAISRLADHMRNQSE